MNSSKDSEPEQSPTHSTDVEMKSGMLRSKVGMHLRCGLVMVLISYKVNSMGTANSFHGFIRESCDKMPSGVTNLTNFILHSC